MARRGACIWFTGLSGSGKSTTAEALLPLLEARGRAVTVLDGDVVRTHLSKGLGFSREDRDTNVRRVGYVAGEVVRHGGLVVAALVSPYRETRAEVRAMVGEAGGEFVEVYVDTPLAVVEERDVKGWYAKARAGEVKEFTGLDDPYEPPLAPELTLQTMGITPKANAQLVIDYLEEHSLLDRG
jgi:sulfate adenylyltransferase